VATVLTNSFLNDSRLILTEGVYTSIVTFLSSSRKIGIDFAGVFRLFSIKIFHELPALEPPFLKLCEQFMLERRPFLQLSGEDNFISVLSGLLDSLKLDALQFLTRAGGLPLPNVPDMQSLFESLPIGILNFLKGTILRNGAYSPDQEPSLSLEIRPLDYQLITSPQMTFDHSDFVPQKLVSRQEASLLSSLPEAFIATYVRTLPGLLAKVNRDYLDAFFAAYRELLLRSVSHPCYLDLFGIFLYLASGLTEFISFETLGPAFLSPVIYNRAYTVFSNLPQEIETFRVLIFDITLAKSPQICFDILFYTADRSPWLYAEQVMRFLLDFSHFKTDLWCSRRAIQALVASSAALRDTYLRDPTKSTHMARMSCLCLYLEFLKNPAILPSIGSHSGFAIGFLQLLFETGLSELFLSELQKGLMKSDFTDAQLQIVPGFALVLNACSSQAADSDFIALASRIFSCVVASVETRPVLIQLFLPLFPAMLNYVVHNPTAALTNHCFTFLQFAFATVPHFTFTTELFSLFVDVIDKLDVKIHNDLMAFLGGHDSKTGSAPLVLKNPIFLPLIIARQRKLSTLFATIEMFTELCRQSRSNCLVCHAGDLDFLLGQSSALCLRLQK
jgi:hypothetical protein